MNKVLDLAKLLIAKPSVTPNDFGCQDILIKRLEKIGFKIIKLQFGEVKNFFAIRENGSPTFMFAGHTDVVPAGDEQKWRYSPFTPTVSNNMLYGRGAADMKGSLASMIVAVEEFIEQHPNYKGSIAFLITADEEGEAVNGTVKVAQYLKNNKQIIDYCLIGEPSSNALLGDVIKNGRRGSLNCKLTIIGKQGHIAYPDLANNPIHLAFDFLQQLIAKKWDSGNEYFDPTSLQISNINAGTGATNVIPNSITIDFNFRYCSLHKYTDLINEVEKLLAIYKLNYEINWQHSGAPFVTPKKQLVNACIDSCFEVCNINSKISTSGGTSDGRFIAPILDTQVVELGPINATIHQINECVNIYDLDKLNQIYQKILLKLLVD